jgi:hypothetical protein
MSRYTTYLALVTFIWMGGCASVGTKFDHQNVLSLELGKTSYKDSVSMFGEAAKVEVKQNSDGMFQLVLYVYVHANIGTAKERQLTLEFRDDLLNAYSYASSFKEDQTLVNTDQLSEIERGTTRGRDMEDLLGRPDGKARCPSETFKIWCAVGTEVWVWRSMNRLSTFGAAYAGIQTKTNTVFVVLDNEGLVVDFGTGNT